MELAEAKEIAYRCHRVLEPLHAMIYFAPEAEERFTEVGLRPGRMGYFASRSAPMGAVGPGPVAATFFNFNPELVARFIPRAWTLADPREVLAARFAAADAALRRLLGDELAESEVVAEAAELAREAADGCVPEGRPLYAAHADLDWPDEPLLVLWHAVSLLREFRGDGHIAALVGAGLNGITALVTHTATGKGFLEPAAKKSRGWSDEQWDAAADYLRTEGILAADGVLTEQGRQLREGIEDTTNFSAASPWSRFGADKADRLHELGRQLSRTAVKNGAFPGNVFGTGSEKAS
ncbi:SCO6745 family protein [Amycolatopsis magusensis]|uniref:SCO6745 family protein n=1 Tax=Amycolatopsis magusensis TaxID=882444 RepID=UPI003C2BF165